MKPSLPRGTRDFSPTQMGGRNFIFDTIRAVFKKFGFAPIETPAFENLSVLTGKYGDEGDQLIFKLVNSGDFLQDIREKNIDARLEDPKKILPLISEKALRYDLTVPFARYVVMNRNEITFPFKRYQIQPVWRADRPQKGRYREFYQCDADVVGSTSLICEAEIILMITEVLTTLGIDDFSIKINNRKILTGIAQMIGSNGREADICTAIDKLDKIGDAGVRKELAERGITEDAISKLMPLILTGGTNEEKISFLKTALKDSPIGIEGVDEIEKVLKLVRDFQIPFVESKVLIDLSLARGLSYYTGAIFEVKANQVQMGSICGGGRYDNLTGLFGMDGVSGVGISFGVDRIYDVMNELKLIPDSAQNTVKVMLTNFDEISEAYCLKILGQLRSNQIASEIYPSSDKLKKQFGYADAKQIPYVLVVGESEMNSGVLVLKNMKTGEQKNSTLAQVIAFLQ